MKDVKYQQQLELKLNATKEATPEEVREWQNGGDFFMSGNFDPMKIFVVVPAVVQMIVIGGMILSFLIIAIGLNG